MLGAGPGSPLPSAARSRPPRPRSAAAAAWPRSSPSPRSAGGAGASASAPRARWPASGSCGRTGTARETLRPAPGERPRSGAHPTALGRRRPSHLAERLSPPLSGPGHHLRGCPPPGAQMPQGGGQRSTPLSTEPERSAWRGESGCPCPGQWSALPGPVSSGAMRWPTSALFPRDPARSVRPGARILRSVCAASASSPRPRRSPSRADTRHWERGAVQRQDPQRCGGRQRTGESRPGESGLAPGATRLGGTPAALSHVPLGPAERAQIPHCKERNQPCGLSRPRAPGLCGGPRRPSAAPSAPALPSPLFLRAGFAESGPVGLGSALLPALRGDVPGVSDGGHPLVTVLRVLCPQLQGFLVLMAEVNREIMLHREDASISGVRAGPAAAPAVCEAPSQPRLGTDSLLPTTGRPFYLALPNSEWRLRVSYEPARPYVPMGRKKPVFRRRVS